MTDDISNEPKTLSKSEKLKRLWDIGPVMIEGTPHAAALGIKFVAVDIGRSTISLPYSAKLIGDPDTRVIAGGAVTTLLDQASGLAAISAFEHIVAVATLDMRIDYMRAAAPDKTIVAQAHCYKTTQHVAFVRAIAHDGDPDDPVATSQASFMTTPLGIRKPKDTKTNDADKKASA